MFEWPENLSIFFDNLCIYHICFDLISFLTFMFTWWYCTYSTTTGEEKDEINPLDENVITSTVTKEYEELDSVGNEELHKETSSLDWNDDTILSNVRFMKQKALVKELKAKLTEDELEQERETKKMQLLKIFQLLQEQEDKFQMTSMEQLEDQLHLYVN